MLLKDKSRRGNVATLIVRKIKGLSEYDDLKDENEDQMEKAPMTEDGSAELDISEGTDSATHEMMEAMESKNPAKLKAALMEFMKMTMREHIAKQKQD